MKVVTKKSLCSLALICFLSANLLQAGTVYLDVNGTTTNSGVVANGTYSWEDSVWTTNAVGTNVTAPWVDGDFPRFAAGNDATGAFTVTANTDHHFAGMLHNSVAATVTINGTGTLIIDPPQQGFFGGSGGFLNISNKLSGTGGIVGQSGQLFLRGTNDFSGGTTPGSGLINFNNPYSFGTGNLIISSSGSALIPEGTTAINITNNWTISINGGSGLNCVGIAAGITYSGNINLGANVFNIGCGGGASALNIFSGVISGTGGIGRQSSTSHGTIRHTGANTYTGKSSFQSSVTSVSSLNSVNNPAQQPSSNLGVPSSVANGTLAMGATTFTGTLVYTGPGETTDRVIDLAGTTGGAILQADGTGALVFTSPNTASGAGRKTLTLQGSSTAANTIAGKIVDGSSATLLVKAQVGTWVLSGTNTFTGGATINAGTLEIGATGKLACAVTNNSGVLKLDGTNGLNPSAPLALVSSLPAGSVNLNFTGTQVINTLYIDSILQATGTWGSPTSGAQNTSPIFTGTGIINVPAAPVIIQEPQSVVTIPQAPTRTFTVAVTGDQPSMTFQWKRNNVTLVDDGSTISGAQTSQLNLFPPYTAGTYTCAITNVAGFTNTLPATLTILATNDYVNAIAASSPIAYWRLDETTGTIANDAFGSHQGVYINANINQPGFSAAAGSDRAIAVPATPGQKGYMVISNSAPDFSFTSFPFTLEAWAYSTNFAAKQRLISTLTLLASANGGYGFAVRDNQTLQYTAGGVDEFDAPLGTQLAAGVWYHFVITCDGNNYVVYLNGNPVATHAVFNTGASPQQLTLGNNPLTYPSEQLYGGIDEVAIYNYALDQLTVTNHYLARYTDLAAPTVTTPVVTPPTNYVSLSSTLTEAAGGSGLTYQWYKGAGTGSPIVGGTDSTLTVGPLQLSDAANYHCVVTDVGNHTADSPLAFLAVLPIPTTADNLNLTNGLVLHLPFDSDYKDISGRANDGTPVGSPTVASGEIGSSALHYGTTNGIATNYVTVGVVSDLQFGASTDFSVSYWVRGTINTNLPFFCDSTGGLPGIIALNGGYYFGPNTTGNGGWAVGLGSAGHEMATSGDQGINDGNWHNLVHVAKRDGNMTTYLDGSQVDNHAISYITDSVNTANPANIGQDGTGGLVVTQDQEGDVDDLGVWRRTLTPLEISGIYLAGATNHVSFAPPINPLVRAALQIVQVSPGQYQIIWTGGGTLQASGDVLGTYTNVPSGTSPYTIPISSSPQLFYRLKY
jgi:autotransporter-associated beta strand protein